MSRIGVVGEKDFAQLFTAVGIEVFPTEDGGTAARTIHRLAREGYAAVFVQEKFFDDCAETVNEYASSVFPAIIPIPDSSGSRGTGMAALKQNVEKAVGVDILFNK